MVALRRTVPAAVEPLEHGPRVVTTVPGEARDAQHGGDAREGHAVVLGRERVDRRGDDGDPVLVETLPGIRLAREDQRVRAFDIGREEAPGLARQVIGKVEPDVRTPQHRHADLAQARQHPGRLGIVQQHDVVRRHASGELVRGRVGDALVDAPLGVAQRPAVAAVTVQPVVQALGEVEEVGLAVHHEPARIEPGPLDVAHQRAQHLGDAAAARG
jgi:hypothetical protein